MDYNKELNVAKTAAILAGKALREFNLDLDIKYKGIKDIVTKADLKSQSVVVETIKKSFPNDNFLTEESSSHKLENNRTWVIDPLDGTVNFSHNIPLYGVSIALYDNSKIVLAVTYLPVFDEIYYAQKGFGCYCNDKRINVSNNSQISKAIINFNDFNVGEPEKIETYNHKKLQLIDIMHKNSMRIKNFSSAVLEFAYLSSGKIDVYFMIFCGFWDIAAGILMVEEAGGKITDFNGNPVNFETKYVIASNGKLHNDYINLIPTNFDTI